MLKIAALAVPAALLLLEPPRDGHITQPGMRHILSICKNSILTNKNLSNTIFLSAVTGKALLCMAWTSQIYFVANGFTEVTITPLWITLNLTVAIVAAFAATAMKTLGKTIGIVSDSLTLSFALISAGVLLLIPAVVTGCRLIFSMPGIYHTLNISSLRCDRDIFLHEFAIPRR